MIRDIDYLKDDKIGKVLAQGMAELYKKQPDLPIHYFGNWLLNYEKQQTEKTREVQKMQQKEIKLQHIEQRLKDEQLVQQQQTLLKQQQENQENEFQRMIQNHQYHEELLISELPNHLEQQGHLSGVYIGKVDHPDLELDIENDDTEDGHLNKQKKKVIKYIGQSSSHSFLNGCILNPDQGITWNVFKLDQIINKKVNLEEGEYNIMNDSTIECNDNYVYVKNVVENGNVYYHRIPQLGGYMAIPLIYESSLLEESFDQALQDRHLYLQEVEQQQKERQDQEQEYQDKLKEMEENNEDTTDYVQQWEQQLKQRQDVEQKDIQTFQQQYVVCCDTMGQDKGIDQQDIDYLQKMVRLMGQSWETNEAQNLKNDIDVQMHYLNSIDNDYTNVVQQFNSEEQEVVETAVGEQQLNEKQTIYEQENARWSKVIEQLQQDKVKEYIRMLAKFRVLKFSQLLQSILLFLGYHKEQINIKNTNILDWKNVKQMFNEQQLFDKIQSYNYKGAKPEQVKDYVKIKRLTKRLSQWNVDEIDKYNLGLGRLYRWITLSLKLRNLDIELRREHKVRMDQEREEKIKAEEERQKEKEAAFQEHKASLMADELEAFNEEEWRQEYDNQNPIIEIPEVLEDDIDNDLEDE